MSDEEFFEQFTPIEDRLLGLVQGQPYWNFKLVKSLMPQEGDKNIYRAINKLEETGRIRCLGWQGRSKQYTTRGVSNLPHLLLPNGQAVDLKLFYPGIPDGYKNGHMVAALKINNLLINIGQLFTLAQIKDEQELLAQYKELVLEFNEYKRILLLLLSWIEAIQKHPIMSGDLNTFKAILAGDSPSQEEINKFNVWVTRFRRGEFN